jgi:hypothetical protein
MSTMGIMWLVSGDWPWDDHEMRLGAQGDLHFPIFLTPCQDCNNFATACEDYQSMFATAELQWTKLRLVATYALSFCIA